MREQCGTKFQRTKSVLYRGSACSLPENLPAGLRFGEEEVDGKMVRGFLLYGAPIGEPDYISLKLRQRAEEIVKDASTVAEVVVSRRQALWAVLRWSINQRFDYYSQLSPPSLTKPVARWLDERLWIILEKVVGQEVPRSITGAAPVLHIPVTGRD